MTKYMKQLSQLPSVEINRIRSQMRDALAVREITPADCWSISCDIFAVTRKKVSETTLKRIFGFANSTQSFSRYTLNAIAEYFEIRYGIMPREIVCREDSVLANMQIITLTRLNTIERRCGIPYQMTIDRKRAEKEFEDFFSGPSTMMAIAALPGHGKTIMLSHLAKRYFATSDRPFSASALLFLSATNFHNADNTSLTLEDYLRKTLFIGPEVLLTDYLAGIVPIGSKILIIIDGFDEAHWAGTAKTLLYDSIIDFTGSLGKTNGVKMMLSMRPLAWARFSERMKRVPEMETITYGSGPVEGRAFTDFLQLDEEEGREICRRADIGIYDRFSIELRKFLARPVNLQVLICHPNRMVLLGFRSGIILCELICSVVKERIYGSNYYTEKIHFLKRIVSLTSQATTGCTVPKDDLMADMHRFRNAYMELLSDGILIEERIFTGGHPRESIGFTDPWLFDYFIFASLLERFNGLPASDAAQHINGTYSGDRRLNHLRALARHGIRTREYGFLEFSALSLAPKEKDELALFIAENVCYNRHSHGDALA
ncbi:MAG: NACHT domain-containing protein [Pedobacter sp.]|nr:MAG: NACHT domain-containing protein [Pedobacter sp.]